MRRPLAVLTMLGLVAAACSGGGPIGPAADTGAAEAVETQSPSESIADPVGEAPGGPSVDAMVAEDEEGAPFAVLADEMMLDELYVGYFAEWPTPHQASQAAPTYDEVLDLMVNWIPFASGDDMGRALEAGDIDIAYSQGLASFAASVASGAGLLLVGVAAINVGAEQAAAAGPVLGVISTTGVFAAVYPDTVTGFLQVNENTYRAYNLSREPFIDTIAAAAGTDRDATAALLDAFTFPERDAQLSGGWLTGTVQQVLSEQIDSLAATGEVEPAPENYDAFIDTSFLESVS